MILNWKDMKVRDQLKIKEIGELQVATEDEKNLMVAAHLAGLDYKELLQQPLDKVRGIMDNCDFLINTPPKPEKPRKKYNVNGRTYILFKDPSEMTVAQFIDFQQIYREGFDKMPGEMLCIFLVPQGHQYNDGYDKEQQLEDMLDLGVEEALGVCDFFIKRCRQSIGRMKTYSNLMLKYQRLKAPKEQKEHLEATRIQLMLILEGLEELLGSRVSGR